MSKFKCLKAFLKSVFWLCFSLLFLCQPLQAKLFKNSYVSFEIPDSWKCKPFGTNWVCHDEFQEKKVEALITSTAKVAGSLDTREQYLNYLKQEKTWYTNKKEQITSQKLSEPKEVFINRYPWIDSIHDNSEVKSYTSRYVGTVCCKDNSSQLGILIVLSAHKDHYKKYSAIFLKAINSLKVLDIEKALIKVRANEALNGAHDMANYMDSLLGEEESLIDEDSFLGVKLSPVNLALLVLGFIALFILLLRKKRKKSRKKKQKTS